MKESLLGALEMLVEEAHTRLQASGLTLDVLESPEWTAKKSFGVYIERAGRGFYLTVWESGEVQVSAIDYGVDASPREKYLSDVHVGQLEVEFGRLLDWVCRSGGSN